MKVHAEPCPFCGGEIDELQTHEFSDDGGHACQVGCTTCGATGPIVRGPMLGRCTQAQRREAERAWNRRVQ